MPPLTLEQVQVLSALISGATITAAAAAAGVHRNTVAIWRASDFAFRLGLSNALYEKSLFQREKAEQLLDLVRSL